jgi:hypothetical protein
LTSIGRAVLNVLDTTGVRVTQEKMSQTLIIVTWKSKFRSQYTVFIGNSACFRSSRSLERYFLAPGSACKRKRFESKALLTWQAVRGCFCGASLKRSKAGRLTYCRQAVRWGCSNFGGPPRDDFTGKKKNGLCSPLSNAAKKRPPVSARKLYLAALARWKQSRRQ